MDVREACEEVFVAGLRGLGLGCEVLPGSREEERPDECVVCEAGEAEHKAGGMYMVELAVHVYVPAGKPAARADAAGRMALITGWLDAVGCPLRKLRDAGTGLYVAGFSTVGQEEDRGTRLVEMTVTLRVGCGMED